MSADIGVSSKMYHGSKDKNPIEFIIITVCSLFSFVNSFDLILIFRANIESYNITSNV